MLPRHLISKSSLEFGTSYSHLRKYSASRTKSNFLIFSGTRNGQRSANGWGEGTHGGRVYSVSSRGDYSGPKLGLGVL